MCGLVYQYVRLTMRRCVNQREREIERERNREREREREREKRFGNNIKV